MGYIFKLLALGGTVSTIGVSVHLISLEPELKYTVPPFAEEGESDILDVRELPRTHLLGKQKKVKVIEEEAAKGTWYDWDWF